MKDQVIRCHLIASVLAADGMISAGERELLNRAMENMGLSAEEKDSVMHFEGAEEAVARGRELPEQDRQAIVDDLLEAALVDGKLSPHETAMVKKIAEALDLP